VSPDETDTVEDGILGLRHLVVVVPGIGGSVLETADGTPVWGQGRTELARGIQDPARLSLAETPELIPAGLLHTITVVPPFPFGVHGYDRLLAGIERDAGPVTVDVARPGRAARTGTDLLLFPYDFRLGVEAAAGRLAAAVDERLNGLTGDARRARVVVIAHSMGGLVARYWLGPLGGAPLCRALVTVATPHRGAPKALDWLINGIRVGRFAMTAATEVLRGWPAAYDLLPRYPAISNGDRTIYPYEVDGPAGAGFRSRAAEAYRMHLDIDAAWNALTGDDRPQVLALFGRGHATLAEATIDDGVLRVERRDAPWLPNAGWAGDGTVPAISAIPLDLGEQPGAWTALAERHTLAPSSPTVRDVLRNLSSDSLAPVRGIEPGHPWLGLDLTDQIPAGTAWTAGARLHGVDTPDTRRSGSGSATPAPAGRSHRWCAVNRPAAGGGPGSPRWNRGRTRSPRRPSAFRRPTACRTRTSSPRWPSGDRAVAGVARRRGTRRTRPLRPVRQGRAPARIVERAARPVRGHPAGPARHAGRAVPGTACRVRR
jgi:hypothetical protein